MSRVVQLCLLFWACLGAAPALADAGDILNFAPASPLPQVRSVHGVLAVTLDARARQVVIGGVTLEAMVYNDVYGGPTLRARPGDVMRIRLVNHLDQPTNLHFHGYRGSPLGRADSMRTIVAPGAAFDYVVRIPRSQPPGLYWYHAHVHGLAERQIMAGLSGMLWIEGLERQIGGLSRIKHEVFGLKQYSIEDSEDPIVAGYFHGLIQTINGGLYARTSLRPGETGLWSFANEDADLPIRLTLANHRFRVIARDGQAGVGEGATDVLVIPPAGRVEALVDAGQSGTYALTADRLTGSGDGQSSRRVMGLLTVEGAPAAPSGPPRRFPAAPDLRGRTMNARRTFTLTETPADNHYYINGKLFDHHRVDTRVPLGNVEEWTIRNDSDDYHAFHIHQVGFQVVEINGAPQPFEGLRDTVQVPERGEIKIRLAFTDPLIVGRFMYHCHVVEHEDKGMMATIEVFDPRAEGRSNVDFALVDQSGHRFTRANLRGRPTLMVYGYTYCPDVCPATLTRMSAWLKALGPDAERLNVVFVTVDPERDTVAALKPYMTAFDPRIRALTGSRRAIDALALAYGVYHKKIPSAGGGYSVDHSAETYVLNARGDQIGRIGLDEDVTSVAPRLRRLLGR